MISAELNYVFDECSDGSRLGKFLRETMRNEFPKNSKQLSTRAFWGNIASDSYKY